jgi:hypothetical protein
MWGWSSSLRILRCWGGKRFEGETSGSRTPGRDSWSGLAAVRYQLTAYRWADVKQSDSQTSDFRLAGDGFPSYAVGTRRAGGVLHSATLEMTGQRRGV